MKNLLMVRTTTHGGGSAARLVAIALLSFGCGAASPGSLFQAASAQTGPSLGSAGSFAALAGSAVTCTDSVVTGNVGVWPGTAITQTNCTITGAIHPADATARLGYLDFLAAYEALKALPCGTTLPPPGNLAGLTLGPGVYCVDAASTTTGGTLTLSGSGPWIFKIGSMGTGALTGTNFNVVMEGGAPVPCDSVYWWVAEAATMTDSAFVGTILAGAAITITRGTFNGDALAVAAVTMTGAAVSACEGTAGPSPGCKDWVTGGGWILLPDGAKGTFGITGGFKHGKLWGHLTYVDHGSRGNDMKVKGTGVTAYRVVDDTTRHIEGRAEVNGVAVTYQVDVMDAGEPGRDDTFNLTLSNGYSASGKLDGGNIQLHKKCRPMICIERDDDDDDGEGEGKGH